MGDKAVEMITSVSDFAPIRQRIKRYAGNLLSSSALPCLTVPQLPGDFGMAVPKVADIAT
jgi:hypothetical protein